MTSMTMSLASVRAYQRVRMLAAYHYNDHGLWHNRHHHSMTAGLEIAAPVRYWLFRSLVSYLLLELILLSFSRRLETELSCQLEYTASLYNNDR